MNEGLGEPMSFASRLSGVSLALREPRRITLTMTFWVVLTSGILLRVWAATESLGFVHPDEHQQYLEAAQHIVHGYGIVYWEYERGVRHYLYPGALASLMWALEALGVCDPVHQAMILRGIMGTTVLVTIALVAYDWMRHACVVAGLGLLCMASWSPDLIFIGARTLSETAMMIPLMLGIFFLDRRPVVAGGLFALMFAVRFQSAFLIVGFLLALVIDAVSDPKGWRQGKVWDFVVGLASMTMVVGAIDWATWGAWYHSPIEYFRVNILEGKAASFGVEPWYRYGEWASYVMLDVSLLFVFLVLVGGWRERRLSLAAIIFVVGHSFVGHKEARFLWPIVPIVLCLAASGLGTVWQRLERPSVRRTFVALVTAGMVWGAWLRFEQIDWHQEPTRSVSLALARTGKFPDVTGVAVIGLHDVYCGNYFYLRKNVPYLARRRAKTIRADPKWSDGTINYLIVLEDDVVGLDESQLTRIATVGKAQIFRVRPSEGVHPDVGKDIRPVAGHANAKVENADDDS